jgi:hypothetical protein
MATVVWRLNPYTGSTVWTYGNYGGLGWTGGEFTPPGQKSKFAAPPADGTDTVFRDHDAAYEAAQEVYKASGHTQADQIAALRAIIRADEAMQARLKDIVNDASLNGTREGQQQRDAAEAAQAAFNAKSVVDKAKLVLMEIDPNVNGAEGDPFTGMPWPGGSGDGTGTGAGSGSGSGNGGAAASGGSGGGSGAAGGMGGAGGAAGTSGTTVPLRDPLVLDLDGDGIETTSTRDGTVILFDHDGDGIKTGTGWVKPDDGWLVLDRNGNGTIDTGRELFGVDTRKSNGQLATDGFDALKDLDANGDGKIDAADSVFANLRIWRDLNQDGISQANELSTLSANNITGIGVNSSTVRTDLGNGNEQTAAGTFTRSNGTNGMTGVNIQY